jgi:hypothetical protein
MFEIGWNLISAFRYASDTISGIGKPQLIQSTPLNKKETSA